jgi:hypothetical protein
MPPSETFMRNNQNYRQAGDWRFDRDSRYTGDGYRRSDGRKKIMGYSQKQGGRRMGGINEFHALQRGARAFSDPRFPGQSAGEIAQDMSSRGETTGFGGRNIAQDTGRPQTAQTGGGKGGFKRFRGPTDDQRKWSRKFQESQTPRTAPAPSAADQGMGGAMGGSVLSASPTSGPAPAPNFSRSALVQGAKKSGDFARVRDQYNTAAVGTGNRMDKMGGITPLSKTGGGPDGTSAFARDKYGAAAEDIRARRDFARGEAPVQRTPTGTKDDPWASTATKLNPYGTATATFGGPARTSGGTMTDPLTGKAVPMKGYLAGQSAVQDTKEPGNTSGAGFYDPKKIRSSMKKGKA